jgi:glucuronosyltransferase
MEFIKMPDLLVVSLLYEIGGMLCDATGKSKGLTVINNYPSDFKFDLIIYDYSFSPCLLGLVHKFNYPPLIGVSAFNNPSYTVDIVNGDKLGLTVKPYYLFYYDGDSMKIHQRLYNGFINFIDSL